MIGSVPFLGRSFLVYYGTDYTIATNAVSSPSRGFYVSLFVRSFQQQRVTRFRPLLGVPISQLNNYPEIYDDAKKCFRPLLGVPISQLLH